MNKESFVNLMLKVLNQFRPMILNAPAKKGWDPIFRKSVESQYQVKQRRNFAIQAIAEEAAMFGHDLSDMISNLEEPEE